MRNFDSLNGGGNGVTRGIEFIQWNGGAKNNGWVTLVLRFYKSKNPLGQGIKFVTHYNLIPTGMYRTATGVG